MSSRYPASYWRARDLYFLSLEQAGIQAVPCSLCGRLVDLSVTGRTPLSRTIDHRHALAMGGELLDTDWWQIVHYSCNARKGARTQKAHAPAPSRDW